MKKNQINYNTETVDGVRIFYREVGSRESPTILLLHGFPTSSHMFRNLIDNLKNRYHLIAPDYPGFGYSDAPSPTTFEYSFDRLSQLIQKFVLQKKLGSFYLYMQDYGSPVGFRIASENPGWIKGLIIQNANAYMEGIGEPLANLFMPFWENRNEATTAPLVDLMKVDGTKFQFVSGVEKEEHISPDSWMHAQACLDRPGNQEIQLSLFYDYRNNPALFPKWQNYFRDNQPPTLIPWGSGDPFFTEAGARAYLKDLPKAELHLLKTGHFALEEKHEEISDLIAKFIG
ncbi:alpha/beta fold hydrolase [Leptospira stimsonii]|uniref:Alpha/beta hydrolase n=1 Tax=Leptospira stimsonii TaxID=2202203 RepID=A0A396Z5M1_9LEPT|nr:alpha/beta hydrolase [Leptospira stimsonii]RHX90749.1 alpha/beta hydrolase [Leptospira stimsonii]